MDISTSSKNHDIENIWKFWKVNVKIRVLCEPYYSYGAFFLSEVEENECKNGPTDPFWVFAMKLRSSETLKLWNFGTLEL